MSLNSPVADRVTAAVLFLLGAGLSWGGFTMDRLEVRLIHPGSIPGLVPMILGVALMGCAILLFAGARDKAREVAETGESWARFRDRGGRERGLRGRYGRQRPVRGRDRDLHRGVRLVVHAARDR